MLDFKKAFDSIWIKGLLFKLNNAGIKGDMWHLLANYLLNRQVYITLSPFVSEPFRCHVGLPQGSTLSPLLFTLYTSDMFTSASNYSSRNIPNNSQHFKFTDDLSLQVAHESIFCRFG